MDEEEYGLGVWREAIAQSDSLLSEITRVDRWNQYRLAYQRQTQTLDGIETAHIILTMTNVLQ